MIYSFTINVNQAIKFYDILGGDKELLGDKNEFENVEKKKEEEKEKEVNEERIVENVIRGKKAKKKFVGY